MSSQKESKWTAKQVSAVRDAVEWYFSEEYLFNPENSYHRRNVSPAESQRDEDDVHPPGIVIQAILNFENVKAEADSLVAGSAAESEKQKIDLIAEALEGSGVVEVYHEEVHGGTGGSAQTTRQMVRRREYLDESHDPALRTVVVHPLPAAGTRAEIKEFFSQYGEVQIVYRVQGMSVTVLEDEAHTAAAAHDSTKEDGRAAPHSNPGAHAFFAVCFSSQQEAAACAAATVSYGKAGSALAQHFFPSRVSVTLLQDYRRNHLDRQRRQADAQLQKNIARSQMAVAALSQSAAKRNNNNNAEADETDVVRQHLAPGKTLKVSGVAPGVLWPEVKAKIGKLAAEDPESRKQVSVVAIVDDDKGEIAALDTSGAAAPASARYAFIVCRNPEAAKDILARYRLIDGPVAEMVHKTCPNLSLLSQEEEKYASEHYTEWCGKRVLAKMYDNRKRSRS